MANWALAQRSKARMRGRQLRIKETAPTNISATTTSVINPAREKSSRGELSRLVKLVLNWRGIRCIQLPRKRSIEWRECGPPVAWKKSQDLPWKVAGRIPPDVQKLVAIIRNPNKIQTPSRRTLSRFGRRAKSPKNDKRIRKG